MTTHPRAAGHESGFSLVEGLIAAALLLIIAVGVLPLFTRALESNIAGGRSSQLSTFVGADIEIVNQGPVDDDDWSIAGEPGGVLDLGTKYWDIGNLYSPTVPDELGDEKWLDEADVGSHEGPIMWGLSASVRKYSLADLHILLGTGGVLVTEGESPFLFDDPLTDDENAHIAEVRVTIREERTGLPAATGQRITVGHYRAF